LWLGGADCGDFFAGNHGCLRGTGKKGIFMEEFIDTSWRIHG
jgi:hypothetical protein